jgi:Uma2 family endonuclease
MGDLLEQLGDIPPHRVWLHPVPGTATEVDVLEAERRENRLCELVDGVLVEKPMGYRESLLALAIGAWLRAFVNPRNLGLVSGSDGMMRLFPGLVRIPDVAFASWGRFPHGRVPTAPLPPLVPDLAIEVLSESNTAAEMNRKVREYFQAGVRLVWLVDPRSRTVAVYTTVADAIVLDESHTLDGGEVLPAFSLSVRDVFAELDRESGPR